jgi:hypothetical protein
MASPGSKRAPDSRGFAPVHSLCQMRGLAARCARPMAPTRRVTWLSRGSCRGRVRAWCCTELRSSRTVRAVPRCVEPAHPARISPLLMSAYGLTQREQEVTRLVLQGRVDGPDRRAARREEHLLHEVAPAAHAGLLEHALEVLLDGVGRHRTTSRVCGTTSSGCWRASRFAAAHSRADRTPAGDDAPRLDEPRHCCQSRGVKSCGPSGSQDLALLAEPERRPPPFRGGSAPLPWNSLGNRSQPTAMVCACLSRSGRPPICHRLLPVATAGLHKGSIRRCLL